MKTFFKSLHRKVMLSGFLGLLIGAVMAQDCETYYPTSEGALLELTNYNRKDKVSGRTVQKITNVSETSNGLTMDMEIEMYDDKDEFISKSDVSMRCEEGVFYLDMEQFLSPETMEAYKEMDVTVTSEDLPVPSELAVGKKLDDGSVTVKIANEGMQIMTMTTTIKNREVVGQEKVTTPAGSFDCYKIAYDIETATIVKINMKGIDWYAKGVGTVKSESYNKNDKLLGYSVLTKFEK